MYNIEEKRKMIRRLMVDLPSAVRDIYLTKHQIKLFDEIQVNRGLCARDLAKSRGWSIQNASGQLARLYEKEYLKRDERVNPTGGIEYFYKVCV